MSILDKIRKSPQGGERELKVSDFFTDNNVNGYSSKEEFLFHIEVLPPTSLLELEVFFKNLKDDKRLDALPIARKDRAGDDYVWCNFQRKQGSSGLKVVLFSDMLKFIIDYQDGVFKVPFTLLELHDEAERKSDAA